MKSTASNEIPWTARDSALWETCEIAAALARGIVRSPRVELMATFPPQLSPDESFWAAGPFVLDAVGSIGDGTYDHSENLFLATGRSGLALTAGFAVGQAVGNARRRRQALLDTIPRWLPVESGEIYVSHLGFHLHTGHRVFPWDWQSITAAGMTAPSTMHLMGSSESGPVSWLLRSDWAELVFVAWALTTHRRHPQLVDGSWLPPGWLQHCRSRYPTLLESPALTV